MRDLLFFERPKKSKQKKGRPSRVAPRRARGSRATWDFSMAHPCASEKRRASCAPPLRGCSQAARRPLNGDP
ncbi:hypothetical protein XthCFBP4691_02780 [Xanthomonas theicola]|uniref:Uncharacterized protein n=1 Tax=Xanthomonas theicola TaxID=56464 RepID=A0A2S6ZKQ0_9XANT|nr:hypothetical protein XthCFBP4691_02780 [Xanthomonas theicola]